MFIKKILYKITDKKKYKEYKIKESLKKKIDWFESGFREKISNITKNIENKKEISFLHSGHLGDIIDSLAMIKEISKTHTCKLFIEADKKIDVKFNKHPAGNVFLNKKMVNMILPLLNEQNYIKHVSIYNKENIDVDLNLFKELAMNFNMDSVRWYFQVIGLQTDLSLPYLKVEPHEKIRNKVVIMRTVRRNNYFINYKFINKYKDLLFIGLEDEYRILKNEIPNLEFYDCSNFLEIARIIKSGKFFLGNLSLGSSIAEALKVPRLFESYPPEFPAIHPNGKNAYDFYFQQHFEKWFDYLYKL